MHYHACQRQILNCITCDTSRLYNREISFFVLSRAWGKEIILRSHEESNLRPSDSAKRGYKLVSMLEVSRS